MTKTLIKIQLLLNKNKNKILPELNNTKSNSPRNLQTFKQKLIGYGFTKYKKFLTTINEP